MKPYTNKDIPRLKRKLKTLFHKKVRDQEGKLCFSCLEPNGNQAGHFMPDGVSGMTRYHYLNVHVQCSRCNLTEYGNQYVYGKRLDKVYGAGTAEYLRKLAHQNNYQDEVATLVRLIQAIETKENYKNVYDNAMKKYERR